MKKKNHEKEQIEELTNAENSVEGSEVKLHIKFIFDLGKALTAELMEMEGVVENLEGSSKQDNQPNPFEKWGLYSVCAYLEMAGRDDEIWDIIDNNEDIMNMLPNERIKHRILVGYDLACGLLDISNERDENDEDYYQMYELSMGGSVWDFSKFGFDQLIEKYPKAVEELNNTPTDLGLFLHGFMNEYINKYYPYSKCRNPYIS